MRSSVRLSHVIPVAFYCVWQRIDVLGTAYKVTRFVDRVHRSTCTMQLKKWHDAPSAVTPRRMVVTCGTSAPEGAVTLVSTSVTLNHYVSEDTEPAWVYLRINGPSTHASKRLPQDVAALTHIARGAVW